MDPLSLGIGALSLTFQLFSGCVKAYNLVSDAKGMPVQFQYLRVRLKTEQHRLLNWADVANLTEQNDSISASLRLNEALVQQVLREQDIILANFWKTNHPYRYLVEDEKVGLNANAGAESELQERFPPAKSSLEKRALRCVEKMRSYPVRIRWAAFDRERFETSLAQLGALNDAMTSLLDSQQQMALHQAQMRTSMQVLELNNKVDHLLQIFQANSLQLTKGFQYPNLHPLPDSISELQGERDVIATLAHFKALNVELNSDSGDEHRDDSSSEAGQLDARSCTILRSSPATFTFEIERSDGMYHGNPAWIEWKYYDPVLQLGQPDPRTQARISKLSTLLSNLQKPAQFRTAACIGYFNDASNNRFGLVFRRPMGPSSANSSSSLFDLFLDEEKPSLSARIHLAHTLATALQYLHSTNWIHKALRSQNVVFFTDPGCPNLSNPFLCGFGLARPTYNTEMTERPDTNPLYNLYRHPLAHSDIAVESIGGFKKAFDIYSLGLVLLETALWMPLHRVLGIKDEEVQRHIRPGVTKRVRGTLLQDRRFLDMVRASAGSVYGEVVRVCLEGMGEDDSQSVERFNEEVVMRLEKLLVI